MERPFAINYRLKRQLAERVMDEVGVRPIRSLYPTGEVYLVEEEGERRVFKIGFSGDERDARHIFPEARALQILVKRGAYKAPLLHSYEELQIDGMNAAYLTKEFLEGKSLDQVEGEKKEGEEIPIPLERFDEITEQVAAAHEAGLCRIDVLPSNILLTPEGRLMLFEYSGVLFRDPIEGRESGRRMMLGGPHQFARYRLKDISDQERVKMQLREKGLLR